MMHEDLLGYLLGALEPDEMQRVAQWLRDDPEARAELDKIKQALRPLRDNDEDERRPGDELPSTELPSTELPSHDLVSRTLRSLPPLPEPIEPDVSTGGGIVPVTAAMNQSVEPPADSRRSWFDWAGGALSAAVLLGLLLPTLANGRLEARKVACQDQFRQLGTALTNFVNRSQQKRLPAVSESGPEAFAGVYAVRLKQVGLLDDPNLRWCPSREMPDLAEVQVANLSDVIDAATLHQVSVDQLKRIQRYAGGHYAYSLGVIDTNGFNSPRFESRSTFAVMSDALTHPPVEGKPGEGTLGSTTVGHSGTGINVLYEDGRVQFVSLSSLDSMVDHPLRNHLGQGEAGINVDDASLAPSWRPPFVHVRQR
tara:strand:- start:87761 stop:88864 length:1104 start_codon:yes stop_codon:yes gene_type:complete